MEEEQQQNNMAFSSMVRANIGLKSENLRMHGKTNGANQDSVVAQNSPNHHFQRSMKQKEERTKLEHIILIQAWMRGCLAKERVNHLRKKDRHNNEELILWRKFKIMSIVSNSGTDWK